MLKRFAILGAGGDLTSRLLLPALADLLQDGRLRSTSLRTTAVLVCAVAPTL